MKVNDDGTWDNLSLGGLIGDVQFTDETRHWLVSCTAHGYTTPESEYDFGGVLVGLEVERWDRPVSKDPDDGVLVPPGGTNSTVAAFVFMDPDEADALADQIKKAAAAVRDGTFRREFEKHLDKLRRGEHDDEEDDLR